MSSPQDAGTPGGGSAQSKGSKAGGHPSRVVLGAIVAALAITGVALWLVWPEKPARVEAPAASVAVPTAPSSAPVVLQQTAGCGEILVTTACGLTVRCSETGEDRMVLRDDGLTPVEFSPCFQALKTLRKALLATMKRPLEYSAWHLDPFTAARRFGCARPSMGTQQKAYSEVLRRVRSEGVARAARMADTSSRSEWTSLMERRFDFVSMEASCSDRETGAFLFRVKSDVGAPGVVPYDGIWRVTPRHEPEKRFEVLESTLATFWGAGDLNGDGIEEIIARSPNVEVGEASHVRYELVDAASGARVVLAASVPVVEQDVAKVPAVYGVVLPSGAALVVGDQIHRYDQGALRPAPAETREEMRIREQQARERIERVLVMIDRPIHGLDKAERCADWTRLGWAYALAQELRAIGPWDREAALADAAPLAGVEGCLSDVDNR
ncbi:MAG: hypothetical protein HUU21_11235 [Polyangiaceae bacterium]|nr:hypothetical protein [Polyangiaceae bacterium]